MIFTYRLQVQKKLPEYVKPVARLCYNRLYGALEFDSSTGRFIYLPVLQENIFTKGNR